MLLFVGRVNEIFNCTITEILQVVIGLKFLFFRRCYYCHRVGEELGKLIVHGRDREECIARLNRCLNEMVVGGIETSIPLFQELLQQPDILAGDYNIHWLERWMKAQAEA